MAAVLKRSVAGERVAALADGLSADLLGDEEQCRQDMEAVFTEGVPDAARALGPVLEGGARDIPETVRRVGELAGIALTRTAPVFRGLLDTAVGKGLESIREELELCERTLGSRYQGLSREACDKTDDAEDRFLDVGVAQYAGNAVTVLGWFEEQLGEELRTALAREEPPELVVARLVSPVSVKEPKHSGRGLWWKVLEHATRITREIEFATVNAARTDAMEQFNRIGEKRRSG